MELRQGEFSPQSMRGTLDELHSKASSVLLFTLQWNDLDRDIVRIRDSIESGAREVQLVKDSLNVAQESIDSLLGEVENKGMEIKRVKEAVEERCRQVEVFEREFGLKQRTDVEERSRETERTDESGKEVDKVRVQVEGKLGEIEEEEERFQDISKAVGDRCGEMTAIERDIKGRMGEFEVKEKEFEDRVREFELRLQRFEEMRRVHEQKEQQFENRLKELESKEKQFEERCQALELKEKQFEKQCKEFKTNEEPIAESISKKAKFADTQHCEKVENESLGPGERDRNSMDGSMDANLHFCVIMDGKALQIFLNEHWKEHDAMRSEVLVALQLSSNPANLVLDAMQGFYPPHFKKEDTEFEGNVVMQSCILLLEQLMKISPPISPNLREEAMQLAFDWITKIRVDVEHYLEVLGFLLLLASYGLASAFDSDELLSYLEIVDHYSQASELLCALGFADKIHAATTSASTLVPSQAISPASASLSKAPLQHQNSSNYPGTVDTDEDPLNLIGGTVSSVPSVQPTCLPPTISSTGQDPSHLKITQATPCNSLSDSTLALSSPSTEPQPIYSLVDLERKSLRLILSVKENDDLVHEKISAALQHSADPAKLVLDLVKGEGFKLDVSKEHCILLLEQLRKLSPLIRCHVKEEALKFANSWKEKLIKQDQLEVVCALHFLATFGLTSSVNANELLSPFDAEFWVNMGPNLRNVLGLADFIRNYIQSLIEKNQRLEAIKVIHNVEMTDKFPLVTMLKDHLNYINKAEISCKARKIAGVVNNRISQLRDLAKCILHYKLESQISAKEVEEQILQLEKQMAKKPQEREESKLKREASTRAESLQKKRKQQQSTASAAAPVVSPISGPLSITASTCSNSPKTRRKNKKNRKHLFPTLSQHAKLPAGRTPPHPNPWPAHAAPPHNYQHPARLFGFAGSSHWERSARTYNFPRANAFPRPYYENFGPHCHWK